MSRVVGMEAAIEKVKMEDLKRSHEAKERLAALELEVRIAKEEWTEGQGEAGSFGG